MVSRILLLLATAFLLTNCNNLTLQRSANNKLIDTQGFKGNKRRPLYNKKYINKAKHNVMQNNYEEDEEQDPIEDDDFANPSARNLKMYRQMLRSDIEDNQHSSESYPDISKARAKAISTESRTDPKLEAELKEIKAMLNSAKKDLAKYRCPMQEAPAKRKTIQDDDYDNDEEIKRKPSTAKQREMMNLAPKRAGDFVD